MDFTKKLFKKRQSQSSLDKIEIILNTSRNLSEEQKNTIKSIIREGIRNRLKSSEMLEEIQNSTGIYSAFLFLEKDEDGIEVYF